MFCFCLVVSFNFRIIFSCTVAYFLSLKIAVYILYKNLNATLLFLRPFSWVEVKLFLCTQKVYFPQCSYPGCFGWIFGQREPVRTRRPSLFQSMLIIYQPWCCFWPLLSASIFYLFLCLCEGPRRGHWCNISRLCQRCIWVVCINFLSSCLRAFK